MAELPPLLIGINTEGVITEIILLKNYETPGFVNTVIEAGFLEKWKGIHWKEAAVLSVDTVSEATMTSSAIKETLRERLSIIDPASTPQPTASGVGFKWRDAGIILFPLVGLYLCLTKGKHHNKIRMVLLGLSILYLGFFTAATFSIALLDSWILNGINFRGAAGIAVLSLAAMIIPIAFGKNVHCFFVCPWNKW